MTLPTFGCGHAKWGYNAMIAGRRHICRQCHKQHLRAAHARKSPDEVYLEHRIRYLPMQIASARAKVQHLEEEARRYGMTELLEVAA